MRLLIVDYLASLKEREELDAILPDLLTELGYNVVSRPRRGTAQRGVDVAAVKSVDGQEVLYLFSIKAGDLTRNEWNGPHAQALRPSLDEIKDSYLHSRVPPRYRDAKVVICLCFGGEIREDVRDRVAGYISANTTDRISYEEWNGGHLADLLLEGLLREQVLPADMRTSFRKAVALVDEPDVAYQHFRKVADQLLANGRATAKARVLSARQLSLCAWILFVWARGAGNVEAAYRVTELALLYAWELRRGVKNAKSRDAKALTAAVNQIAQLHVRTALELLDEKVLTAAAVQDGVSIAVRSSNPADVNLALFEILGRVGLLGIWLDWMSARASGDVKTNLRAEAERILAAGLTMIEHNPALLLPATDAQATDVAIFLQLFLACGANGTPVREWIEQMIRRLLFTLRTRARYPISSKDYRDLIEHPRDSSDEYFKEMTGGSVLIPLLVLWARPLRLGEELAVLSEVVVEHLGHCTFQLWTPDHTSEEHLYVNDAAHGYAIADLPVDSDGSTLFSVVRQAAQRQASQLDGLSAVAEQFWPLVLVACRHYRLPVPPGLWIEQLVLPKEEDSPEGAATPATD